MGRDLRYISRDIRSSNEIYNLFRVELGRMIGFGFRNDTQEEHDISRKRWRWWRLRLVLVRLWLLLLRHKVAFEWRDINRLAIALLLI